MFYLIAGENGDHLTLTVTLIIGIFITVCSIILHATGIYLLRELHKGKSGGTENILLMNLAISELFLSIGSMIRNIALLIFNMDFDYAGKVAIFVEKLYYTCFSFVFYSVMIYIPLHRCIKILLGLKYINIWSSSKTRILCVGTWVVSIVSGAAFIVLHYFIEFDYMKVLFMYIYPTLNSIMIVTSTIAYILIYRKYKQSENRSRGELQRRAKNSKFYIPTLLIITFFIFIVIPDTTVLIYFIILKKDSKILHSVFIISYTLALKIDATIYIFFQKAVRELLLRKVCTLHKRKEMSSSSSSGTCKFTGQQCYVQF